MNTQITSFSLSAYKDVTAEELNARIMKIREKWGKKILILGHYYVADDVLEQTDLQGDSFALSRLAADNTECRAIIFCGVHFMAETADILANRPERVKQRNGMRIPVVLPDLSAGCPMADMATERQISDCWTQLGTVLDVNSLIPVTYVNSTASVKAFCGRHGGSVCTSANAAQVLEWAFKQGNRVLFSPDEHLGRNTALKMGIPETQIVRWDRSTEAPLGGLSPSMLRDARIILWGGCCPVHEQLLPEWVDSAHADNPHAHVVVHPEATAAVVMNSDSNGSTTYIIRTVQNALPGSTLVVGTEAHLVARLRNRFSDRTILDLGGPHFCDSMGKITLQNLCWALENLDAGVPVNVISVPESTASDALLALERMLKL